MRRAAVLVLGLAACAHHAGPPAAGTAAAKTDAKNPHGASGADRPVALPHHVVDGRTGQAIDEAALAARLRDARVIYVGEQHASPHDHAAQLQVLERVYAVDPSVGVGFEMLPHTKQPALDRYVAGVATAEAFVEEVDWKHTWGFPFGLYRPLFDFARAHGLPAVALNAPRELTKAVAKRGTEGLDAAQRQALPELVPGPAAHRELVREAYGAHPHAGRFGAHRFERFYQAQLVWDETMAERVAQALSGPAAPKRLVVVAGEGHTRRFAIPERAARRGAAPYLTIVPVLDRDLDDALKDDVAELYWVLETPR